MAKRKKTKPTPVKTPNTGIPGMVDTKPEIISVKKALDAYTNGPANLGLGANNLAESGAYVMQRMTWDYWTLNILFRNNWIAKAIIEKPANEMLKNGFEIQTELDPDKVDKIMRYWTSTKTRDKFIECLKWARLYGGCILVPMIEGQDNMEEPLDYDTIMPDSYKGCFNVDRWCGVSPSAELVTDIDDPDFGTPEFYDVSNNTNGRVIRIHHSRVIKMIGRKLPYWEELAENYWGASELEHVYTELKKRDDTSANISFLIFLANIRVLSMEGLGQMITLGDQEGLQKVWQTMQAMNRLMCNTGTLALDKDDSFTTQQYSFTGINDVYESFMLDISGAAEIPIDKLFGRSPSGFDTGEETLQNYYDTIQEKQESYVRGPLEKIIKIITMSAVGEIPDDLEIVFSPIRRPSAKEMADIAQTYSQPVLDAYSAGIFGKGTVLRELKQQSKITGIWTNITDKMIEEADKEDEEKQKQEQERQDMLDSGVDKLLQQKEQENQNSNSVDNGGKEETQ